MDGMVYQINIKSPKADAKSLPKIAVPTAKILRRGIEGDFNNYRHEKQDDRRDWAISLLPFETIVQLNRENWPVKPGDLGENLTISGLSKNALNPGSILLIGKVIIQLTEAITPCDGLYILDYVGREKGKQFLQTLNGRRGMFAEVIKEGMIRRGDRVDHINPPPKQIL